MILGSCLANPEHVESQVALHDAWASAPQVHLHLGDWGYWGAAISEKDSYLRDLDMYTKHNTSPNLTDLKALLDVSNLEGVCISDHELEKNDDGRGGIHGTVSQEKCQREIQAFTSLFPVRQYGDTRTGTGKRFRAYYTDLAPHVRLVVSDFRCPDRNNYNDADTEAKQMWGAEQESWLFNDAFNVSDDMVLLFVNETSWWRRQAGEAPAYDKPASYPNAQDRFVEALNTIPNGGTRKIIDRFVWLGGDRHYCGYLAADDERNPDGFPQLIGSGWSQHALLLKTSEFMTWITPTQPTGRPVDDFSVCQYMHLTLSYNGTDQVQLTGKARTVDNTHRIVHGGQFSAGSDILTNNSINDTFTVQDEGEALLGIDIDPGATIQRYIGPHRVQMSTTASKTRTGVPLNIYTNPNIWNLVSFPDNTGTTLSFPV